MIDRGYGEFHYVSGERGNNKDRYSHAWLLQDQLIIDITADQFNEIEQKVTVTDSSEWHKTFKTKLVSIADFSVYDDYSKAVLQDAYNVIKSRLDAA